MKGLYLGIDLGSVSTNLAVINNASNLIASKYLRTEGNPVKAIQTGMADIKSQLNGKFDGIYEVAGVGCTGSARDLAGLLVGADVVKNEITAHATAALHLHSDVRCVMEIGGQDSKIIFLKDGLVTDFKMNTVCAAGTGSFLDNQAERLDLGIDKFGPEAVKSKSPVRIAGRCTVFAESDMIHKQQMGHKREDIIMGLCDAMVRNYLNNLAAGKEIHKPVMFQGGVAANVGMKKAFEKELGHEVIITDNFDVAGAIGAALLAKKITQSDTRFEKTCFYGFRLTDFDYKIVSFDCHECENVCEVVQLSINGKVGARWGDKCGVWTFLGEGRREIPEHATEETTEKSLIQPRPWKTECPHCGAVGMVGGAS
jgi:predicted CoA-substrate-specific enzyme activase